MHARGSVMGKVLKFVAGFFGGGALDRVLATVDKKIKADTDREKLKSEIVRAHYRNRADWMRSGGFTLSLLFAMPLALWFGSVVLYSVFWCAACAYPQTWVIAALPAPLDEWAGMIIISVFGVIGVSRFK